MSVPAESARFRFTHRQSLALVVLFTLLGAVAQYLIKSSAAHPMTGPDGTLSLLAVLKNYAMWEGLALYGISTVFLVAALRDGALGQLYPVISLGYVWVLFMSYFVFREELNAWKLAGVVLICGGVTLLGLEGDNDARRGEQ